MDKIMVVRTNNQALANLDWGIIKVDRDRFKVTLRVKAYLLNTHISIYNKNAAKHSADATEGLGVLWTSINTWEHWTITVLPNTPKIPLDTLKKLKRGGGAELLVQLKAAYSIEEYMLKVLLNAKFSEELTNLRVSVIEQQSDVFFAQFSVKLLIHVCAVDDLVCQLCAGEQVIAGKTKSNYSHQLSLLF